VEFSVFDIEGGHLGVGNDNAFGVLAGVELAAHGEAGLRSRGSGCECPHGQIVINHMSIYTADSHMRKIFRKLETNNRTVAVVKALTLGLIHL
jgi:hypothetical protein